MNCAATDRAVPRPLHERVAEVRALLSDRIRFSITASGLNVGKQDLKRFSDFVNHQVYDLPCPAAVTVARATGRNIIFVPFDLPITKGSCRMAVHAFMQSSETIELGSPNPGQIT